MNLRDKYNHAIQTAKGFHMEGSADERDGKLYFKGMVKNQDEVNKIWDAIKTVPDWRNDIVAEVTIDPNAKARRDLHRQVRRHAQQDREGAPWQRERLHEDL